MDTLSSNILLASYTYPSYLSIYITLTELQYPILLVGFTLLNNIQYIFIFLEIYIILWNIYYKCIFTMYLYTICLKVEIWSKMCFLWRKNISVFCKLLLLNGSWKQADCHSKMYMSSATKWISELVIDSQLSLQAILNIRYFHVCIMWL